MDLKQKHLRNIIILAVIGLALFVLHSFIIAIISSAVVAYLFWPVHKKIRTKTGDYLSALLITTISVLVVVGAFYYGLNLLLEESANLYVFLSKIDVSSLSPNIQNLAKRVVTKLINAASEQLVTIPHLLISGLIFFISLFYFLKEGEFIYSEIASNFPFEKAHKKKIIKNIKKYLDGFIHVQVVIGIVQGVLAAIGFWVFGLPYPVLAGFAAGILSLLPGIGPYILYIPVGIVAYYTYGLTTATGLIIYGLTLGSIMDYLVRPFFYGRKVKMHPLIMFLGIFGGLEVMGFIGIVVGPIILSITIVLIKQLISENG